MTILVTGATGNIGRKVVDHLVTAGATDIRALTNHPERAALPDTVDVAKGYLRRLDTVPAALRDVETMYLAPVPETVGAVLALARDAGVRHIVDLSGEHESWWGSIAIAVEQSGLEWTHLWAGEFAENYTTWAEPIRTTGEIREPNPDVISAPVTMDDIARVAATALLGAGHAGKAYTLTGPESTTRAEKLRVIGDVLGTALRFVQVSREEAIVALGPEFGDTAEWYVDNVLLTQDSHLPANRTIEEVTGIPATSFAAWAAANYKIYQS